MSKITGIYKIENLINKKIYIGRSLDVEKRIGNHKYKLKNNLHYNKYLQSSFNKYGLSNFKFETIEICSEKSLNVREMYWIKFYNSFDRIIGYNLQEPSLLNDYRQSEETVLNLRERQTKYLDTEILNMIVKYFKKYNKIPSMNDFSNEYKGLITGDRVKTRFKGFRVAVEKSSVFDLVENISQTNGYYNRKILLKFLKSWIEYNGRVPTQSDINDDVNMPSIQPYLKEFISLNDAIEILGFEVENKRKH